MGGQVSTSSSFSNLRCRNANEDWMSTLCPRLWDVPLHHLSIPGSHDTMTYCLNKKSPISHEESRLLQLLNKAFPCITRPIVLKWSITQALDVTEQLDAGVRYLDLRNFIFGLYSHVGLSSLSGVPTSRPSSLLGAPRVPGSPLSPAPLNSGALQELPTLRQLWSRGQQVIVSYEDESSLGRHCELWPGIPYWWGNTVKTEALLRYLETMKSCGRPGGLFVAGTNLTENLQYVLAHPSESLEKMTLPNLPRLSAWVREQRPGPGSRCTNVIAGDFIGADSFVGDVIALNQKLLWC
uniref:PI-PLC X domain-containing protein 1 n=1 Tax=Piliocolobus tephrosceles TaxID=591936 RepID=A0A8C9HI73_9PRIM